MEWLLYSVVTQLKRELSPFGFANTTLPKKSIKSNIFLPFFHFPPCNMFDKSPRLPIGGKPSLIKNCIKEI